MKPTLTKYLTRTLVALTYFTANTAVAQDCTSELSLNLKNVQGGVYSNQIVVLKSKEDGKEYSGKSNAAGVVSFDVPCDEEFTVAIQNYNQQIEMSSPKENGESDSRNIAYEPNLKERDMFFAMSTTEKVEIDHYLESYPDTMTFQSWMMPRPKEMKHFSVLTIKIKDLRDRSLYSEQVTMTGLNRNKSFRGNTSSAGMIVFYLPKGDVYSVNFKHNKEFAMHPVDLTHGSVESRMNLMYIGTEEVERRLREEELANKLAEEAAERERAEFLAWCEEKGITEEEGHMLKLMEGGKNNPDSVVTMVFNRNKWENKLIVGDLTGSMIPYAGQLTAYYQLMYAKGEASQFVFFNDGDRKPNSEKVIGETGGIYYQDCRTISELLALMTLVRSNGGGGDCPENNMEALIKGVREARSYTDLIMIADNNAPVKDIELLDQFDEPVHIVLCGVRGGKIKTDYLDIAWKTGGSIHTMEEDIVRIATMKEGQSLKIGGIEYRLMGGEFVRVSGT